jgi:hypothetical protein
MVTFKNLAAVSTLLAGAAFGMLNATGCSTEETLGDEHVGATDEALTAAQCEYFNVNGSVQICHRLGNGKFKILKISEQGCINGHSGHSTDYVAVNDPTCQGNGCLAPGAPCDATLPCCEGSTCTAGVCTVPSDPCIAPQVLCGGICSDLQSDNNNCGSCGHACDINYEQCNAGNCDYHI